MGWALWGNDQLVNSHEASVGVKINCILERNTLCKRILDVLEQDFKDVYLPEVHKISVDDKKALSAFEKSVITESGHYKIALPWWNENPNLPNNYEMAEKRLLCLKRKMLSNADFKKDYCSKMQEYIDCGYASIVENSEVAIKGRTWYVPYHGVTSSNKFRIDFGCSPESSNVSLNDKLFAGASVNELPCWSFFCVSSRNQLQW